MDKMNRFGILMLLTWFLMLIFVVSVVANPYDYRIIRVIDGDTVEFEAPFLPNPLKQKLSLRIDGIDTPEKGFRADCSEENMKSLNAKLFTEQEIMGALSVKILIRDWDKYGGRVLGDVILDGEKLSERLIKNGYAIPYDGGHKESWCPY